MKVLALSYLFPNSRMPNHGIFVLNRLKALSRYVDLRVINPVPWSPVHRYHPRYRIYTEVPLQEEIGGLQVYHPRFLSIPGAFKGLEAITYRRAVRQLALQLSRDFPFDLVDMHWTYPDLPAGLGLAEAAGKPSIVTLRGKEAFYREDGGSRAAMIVDGLRQVDRIVALSQELADVSNDLIGANDKTRVIRNGVDVSNFGYLPQEQARAQLGLPDQGRIILSVGSLIRRKGFDLIIDSLHRLRQQESFRDLRLFIVGSEGPEGNFRSTLERQVAHLGLGDAVVFVGQVMNAQLPFWYNAADVFCLASRGEGCPNVLTEALACGCPSVASDVGAVRDIMESEPGQGMCFRSDCLDELTTALGTVLSTVSSRSEAAERMRIFDWDWCARQVRAVYLEATGLHAE